MNPLTNRVLLIGVFCWLAFGCVPAEGGERLPSLPGKPDSLTVFLQWMELGDEGSYRMILNARKHPAGRLAPQVFRDFIADLEPQRIHFCQGVDYYEGMLTFWWSMDECAVATGSDTLRYRVGNFFKNLEWVRPEGTPEEELQFENPQGSRLCSFRYWDISDYKREKLSGGKVRYQIRFQSSIPAPLVGMMQKSYPAVFAPEFPPALMKMLKDRTFTEISYGGTWDRYYVWSLAMPCQTAENADALRKSLISAVRKYGFVFSGENEGVASFRLISTDNTCLITISSEEGEVVRVRFQAYS